MMDCCDLLYPPLSSMDHVQILLAAADVEESMIPEISSTIYRETRERIIHLGVQLHAAANKHDSQWGDVESGQLSETSQNGSIAKNKTPFFGAFAFLKPKFRLVKPPTSTSVYSTVAKELDD